MCVLIKFCTNKYITEEPDAVVPHVRICVGDSQVTGCSTMPVLKKDMQTKILSSVKQWAEEVESALNEVVSIHDESINTENEINIINIYPKHYEFRC